MRRSNVANSSAGRRHGFTLVELLVVIGVVSILIALLLPALNKARAVAQQIKCAAQIRNLGQAAFQYVADNKGWLPPTWSACTANAGHTNADFVHWQGPSLFDLLYPYGITTEAQRVCPTASLDAANLVGASAVNPNRDCSYYSNYIIMNANGQPGSYFASSGNWCPRTFKLVQVEHSSSVALFVEEGVLADWYPSGSKDLRRLAVRPFNVPETWACVNLDIIHDATSPSATARWAEGMQPFVMAPSDPAQSIGPTLRHYSRRGMAASWTQATQTEQSNTCAMPRSRGSARQLGISLACTHGPFPPGPRCDYGSHISQSPGMYCCGNAGCWFAGPGAASSTAGGGCGGAGPRDDLIRPPRDHAEQI